MGIYRFGILSPPPLVSFSSSGVLSGRSSELGDPCLASDDLRCGGDWTTSDDV